nr:PREDICTED: uncharacterized protein LOC109044485 [Bemisia tabaci]
MNLRSVLGPENTAVLLIAAMIALISLAPCQAALHHSNRESARIIGSFANFFNFFGTERKPADVKGATCKRSIEPQGSGSDLRHHERGTNELHDSGWKILDPNLQSDHVPARRIPRHFMHIIHRKRPKDDGKKENRNATNRSHHSSMLAVDKTSKFKRTPSTKRNRGRKIFKKPISHSSQNGNLTQEIADLVNATNELPIGTWTLPRELLAMVTKTKANFFDPINELDESNSKRNLQSKAKQRLFDKDDQLFGDASKNLDQNRNFLFHSESSGAMGQDENGRKKEASTQALSPHYTKEDAYQQDFLFLENRPPLNTRLFGSAYYSEPEMSGFNRSNVENLRALNPALERDQHLAERALINTENKASRISSNESLKLETALFPESSKLGDLSLREMKNSQRRYDMGFGTDMKLSSDARSPIEPTLKKSSKFDVEVHGKLMQKYPDESLTRTRPNEVEKIHLKENTQFLNGELGGYAQTNFGRNPRLWYEDPTLPGTTRVSAKCRGNSSYKVAQRPLSTGGESPIFSAVNWPVKPWEGNFQFVKVFDTGQEQIREKEITKFKGTEEMPLGRMLEQDAAHSSINIEDHPTVHNDAGKLMVSEKENYKITPDHKRLIFSQGQCKEPSKDSTNDYFTGLSFDSPTLYASKNKHFFMNDFPNTFRNEQLPVFQFRSKDEKPKASTIVSGTNEQLGKLMDRAFTHNQNPFTYGPELRSFLRKQEQQISPDFERSKKPKLGAYTEVGHLDGKNSIMLLNKLDEEQKLRRNRPYESSDPVLGPKVQAKIMSHVSTDRPQYVPNQWRKVRDNYSEQVHGQDIYNPAAKKDVETEFEPFHATSQDLTKFHARNLLSFDDERPDTSSLEAHYIVQPREDKSMIHAQNQNQIFQTINQGVSGTAFPLQNWTAEDRSFFSTTTGKFKNYTELQANDQSRYFLNDNLKCQFLRGNLPQPTIEELDEQMKRGNEYSYFKRIDMVKGNKKSIVYKIVLINSTSSKPKKKKGQRYFGNSLVLNNKTQKSPYHSHRVMMNKLHSGSNCNKKILMLEKQSSVGGKKQNHGGGKQPPGRSAKFAKFRGMKEGRCAYAARNRQASQNKTLPSNLTPIISDIRVFNQTGPFQPIYSVSSTNPPHASQEIFVGNLKNVPSKNVQLPQQFVIPNQVQATDVHASFGKGLTQLNFNGVNPSQSPQMVVCKVQSTPKPLKTQVKESIKHLYPGRQKSIRVTDCKLAVLSTTVAPIQQTSIQPAISQTAFIQSFPSLNTLINAPQSSPTVSQITKHSIPVDLTGLNKLINANQFPSNSAVNRSFVSPATVPPLYFNATTKRLFSTFNPHVNNLQYSPTNAVQTKPQNVNSKNSGQPKIDSFTENGKGSAVGASVKQVNVMTRTQPLPTAGGGKGTTKGHIFLQSLNTNSNPPADGRKKNSNTSGRQQIGKVPISQYLETPNADKLLGYQIIPENNEHYDEIVRFYESQLAKGPMNEIENLPLSNYLPAELRSDGEKAESFHADSLSSLINENILNAGSETGKTKRQLIDLPNGTNTETNNSLVDSENKQESLDHDLHPPTSNIHSESSTEPFLRKEEGLLEITPGATSIEDQMINIKPIYSKHSLEESTFSSFGTSIEMSTLTNPLSQEPDKIISEERSSSVTGTVRTNLSADGETLSSVHVTEFPILPTVSAQGVQYEVNTNGSHDSQLVNQTMDFAIRSVYTTRTPSSTDHLLVTSPTEPDGNITNQLPNGDGGNASTTSVIQFSTSTSSISSQVGFNTSPPTDSLGAVQNGDTSLMKQGVGERLDKTGTQDKTLVTSSKKSDKFAAGYNLFRKSNTVKTTVGSAIEGNTRSVTFSGEENKSCTPSNSLSQTPPYHFEQQLNNMMGVLDQLLGNISDLNNRVQINSPQRGPVSMIDFQRTNDSLPVNGPICPSNKLSVLNKKSRTQNGHQPLPELTQNAESTIIDAIHINKEMKPTKRAKFFSFTSDGSTTETSAHSLNQHDGGDTSSANSPLSTQSCQFNRKGILPNGFKKGTALTPSSTNKPPKTPSYDASAQPYLKISAQPEQMYQNLSAPSNTARENFQRYFFPQRKLVQNPFKNGAMPTRDPFLLQYPNFNGKRPGGAVTPFFFNGIPVIPSMDPRFPSIGKRPSVSSTYNPSRVGQFRKRFNQSTNDLKRKDKKHKASEIAQHRAMLEILKNSSMTLKEFQDNIQKLNHDVQRQRQLLLNLKAAQEKKLRKKFPTLSGDQLAKLLDSILKKSEVIPMSGLPQVKLDTQLVGNLPNAWYSPFMQAGSPNDNSFQGSNLLPLTWGGQFEWKPETLGQNQYPLMMQQVSNAKNISPQPEFSPRVMQLPSHYYEYSKIQATQIPDVLDFNNQYEVIHQNQSILQRSKYVHDGSLTLSNSYVHRNSEMNDLSTAKIDAENNSMIRVARKYVQPRSNSGNSTKSRDLLLETEKPENEYLNSSTRRKLMSGGNMQSEKQEERSETDASETDMDDDTDDDGERSDGIILTSPKIYLLPSRTTSQSDEKVFKHGERRNDFIDKSYGNNKTLNGRNFSARDRKNELKYGLIKVNGSLPGQILIPAYIVNNVSSNVQENEPQVKEKNLHDQEDAADFMRGIPPGFWIFSSENDHAFRSGGNLTKENSMINSKVRDLTTDDNRHAYSRYGMYGQKNPQQVGAPNTGVDLLIHKLEDTQSKHPKQSKFDNDIGSMILDRGGSGYSPAMKQRLSSFRAGETVNSVPPSRNLTRTLIEPNSNYILVQHNKQSLPVSSSNIWSPGTFTPLAPIIKDTKMPGSFKIPSEHMEPEETSLETNKDTKSKANVKTANYLPDVNIETSKSQSISDKERPYQPVGRFPVLNEQVQVAAQESKTSLQDGSIISSNFPVLLNVVTTMRPIQLLSHFLAQDTMPQKYTSQNLNVQTAFPTAKRQGTPNFHELLIQSVPNPDADAGINNPGIQAFANISIVFPLKNQRLPKPPTTPASPNNVQDENKAPSDQKVGQPPTFHENRNPAPIAYLDLPMQPFINQALVYQMSVNQPCIHQPLPNPSPLSSAPKSLAAADQSEEIYPGNRMPIQTYSLDIHQVMPAKTGFTSEPLYNPETYSNQTQNLKARSNEVGAYYPHFVENALSQPERGPPFNQLQNRRMMEVPRTLQFQQRSFPMQNSNSITMQPPSHQMRNTWTWKFQQSQDNNLPQNFHSHETGRKFEYGSAKVSDESQNLERQILTNVYADKSLLSLTKNQPVLEGGLPSNETNFKRIFPSRTALKNENSKDQISSSNRNSYMGARNFISFPKQERHDTFNDPKPNSQRNREAADEPTNTSLKVNSLKMLSDFDYPRTGAQNHTKEGEGNTIGSQTSFDVRKQDNQDGVREFWARMHEVSENLIPNGGKYPPIYRRKYRRVGPFLPRYQNNTLQSTVHLSNNLKRKRRR